MNVRINDRYYYDYDVALFNAVLDVSFNESGVVEPVTLQEAKDFAKIDVSDDDALITEFIKAARQMCEDYTNLSFVQRVVTAYLNNSLGGISLPYGPVNGDVTSITDQDGTAFSDAEYRHDIFRTVLEPINSYVKVVYNAGYAVLPKKLKIALLNAIYYLYDNRAVGAEDIGPIAKMLLKPMARK